MLMMLEASLRRLTTLVLPGDAMCPRYEVSAIDYKREQRVALLMLICQTHILYETHIKRENL